MSAAVPPQERRHSALARFKSMTLISKSEVAQREKKPKKAKKEKKKKAEERPSLAARLDASVSQPRQQYLDIQDKEKLFSLSDYEPEQYVRQLIVSRSLEQAKEELRLLELEHQTAELKIKRKMFQSYQVFISQGAEIGGLEADIASMQATLVDLRAAAETLQGDAQLLQSGKDAHKMLALNQGERVEKPSAAAGLAADVAALLDAQEELEVLLPMRRYPEAVAAIEKIRALLKQKPALAVDSVTRRLEQHAATLSTLLIAELRLPLLRSTATAKLVSYLARLGMQDKATTVVLDTASTALERKLRQVSGAVRVQGNPTAYITEEAETVMDTIVSVSKEYKTLFPEPVLYGACLQWAVAELEKFGALLQKQLAALPEDLSLVLTCIAAVKTTCQKLDVIGVPLAMSVLDTLEQSLQRTWADHTTRSLVAVQKAIDADNGAARSQFTYHVGDAAALEDTTTVRVTESGKLFNSLLLRFVDASMPLVHASSARRFALLLQEWFIALLTHLDRRIRMSPTLNDRQQLALLANGYYAAATLQERTWRLLEQRGGDESLYEGLSAAIATQYATVQRQLCAMRAEYVVQEKMDWSNYIYENGADTPTRPSTKIAKLHEWLCGTASAVAAIVSPDSVVGFMADLLEETCARLAAATGAWGRATAASGNAREQILFDVIFLETALAPVLTELAKKELAGCVEQLGSKGGSSSSSSSSSKKEKRESGGREAKYSAQVAKAIAQLKAQNISLELPAQRT